MKNKKIIVLISIIIGLLILLLLTRLLLPNNNNKDKTLSFEEYIYYKNDDIENAGFKEVDDDDNISNTYYEEGTFLGRTGTAYFYRTNFNRGFVKNAFVIELEHSNDEEKLDNEIQGFIEMFKNFINYENGSISNTLLPTTEKEVDYEKTLLRSVLDNEATLIFFIENNDKSYQMTVYNENNKIKLETAYTGDIEKVEDTKIPEGINGVG